MKHPRSRSAVAAVGALALTTLAALAASPASASDRNDHDSGAGSTTVVLNPDLVPTLVNTLRVAPIRPGRLSAPGGLAQVAFPITAIKGGVISHTGGLRFTPVGGGDLRITRFDVNLNTGYLTATTRLDGTKVGRVNIFAVGSVQPINGSSPSCAGVPAGLTLTKDAANALGAPSFAGAFVGDACVVPATQTQDDD